MPRQDKQAIARFEQLTALEEQLLRERPGLHKAAQDTEAKLPLGEAALLQAEADRQCGLPDSTEQARQDLAGQRQAVEDRRLALDANRVAVEDTRRLRGELVREHRQTAFMPAAREAEKQVVAAVGRALEAVDQYAAAGREAATVIDRMRPRDRRDGTLNGVGARLPTDPAALVAALSAVVEGGMLWPADVDRQTGAPVSIRERRERAEAEQLRRRGWTPPTGREAA